MYSYCVWWACLFVSLSTRLSREPHVRTSSTFCVACCRLTSSVFLGRYYNTLCTSGFVDDIRPTFPIMSPAAAPRYHSSLAAMRVLPNSPMIASCPSAATGRVHRARGVGGGVCAAPLPCGCVSTTADWWEGWSCAVSGAACHAMHRWTAQGPRGQQDWWSLLRTDESHRWYIS